MTTMTQFKRQIIAVLAAGSTALSGLAPMAVAAEITISGNGSNSENVVNIQRTGATTVTQLNNATVSNVVTNNSSTGENRANDNTGGDVMIRTGDARSNTIVNNQLNNNMAHVECCDANELHINVSGNGSFSDNRVNVNHGRNGSDTQVFQTNNAAVTNSVNAKAQTGENTANRNTGGNVSVRTGDALTSVEVSTTANANAATIGGEGHGNGSISARIMGNGSRSNNTIDLNLDSSSLIVQENNAVVSNGISSDASTGTNNTNDNTGGDVMIRTGNARAGIVIDNLVNFNAADIDCGCILDLEAKIANNGSESDNQVDMNLGGDIEIFQGEGAGNNALLVNVANSETESGENRANFNTGRPGDDPSIWTGNAWSYTDVSNTGNVNMYGGHMWTFPEFEWEWSFARLFMR